MYNLCPSAVFLQGATDEFVLDLVEQCTFQKQRIMHLVMTSRYGSGFITVALDGVGISVHIYRRVCYLSLYATATLMFCVATNIC